MKLFKYKQFIKESNEYIHSICEKWGIINYTINEDGSIDVDGNVDLTNKVLTDIPLKFRSVSGYFSCGYNKLTSLEGAPISVGCYFDCSDNKLTNLEGAPKEIGSDFDCSNNELTNLEGAPDNVGGCFYCDYNELTNLEGAPDKVGSSFYCGNNELTSLEGSPKEIGGYFSCFNNKLTTLKGITQNRSIKIFCAINNLRDVEGIKEGWRGRLVIHTNPVYEIFKLFSTLCSPPEDRFDEVVEYLNEYNVIRDGDKVVLQALEMVFHEMGLDVPEIEYISGYEII
jgi:hypothetical protein